MGSIRFYAFLTAGALLASLALVVGPQPQSANARPNHGLLMGTVITVTPPTESTTTSFQSDPAPSNRSIPPTTETTIPRRTSTTGNGSDADSAPPKSHPTTTTVPNNTTTSTAPATTVPGGLRSDYATQFASRINELRASNGKPALSRSGSLDTEAASWAKNMAMAGALGHSDLNRLIPPWSAVAENVGDGGSVSSVFSAFAQSSGHRANMLGDFTHLGVGVWVDSQGIIWTVHLFAR